MNHADSPCNLEILNPDGADLTISIKVCPHPEEVEEEVVVEEEILQTCEEFAEAEAAGACDEEGNCEEPEAGLVDEIHMECCLEVLENEADIKGGLVEGTDLADHHDAMVSACKEFVKAHWDEKCGEADATAADEDADWQDKEAAKRCRLPSMEEDRCARQCAWTRWTYDEDNGWTAGTELTIDQTCYDYCNCGDGNCVQPSCTAADSYDPADVTCLLDTYPDHQFYDYHAYYEDSGANDDLDWTAMWEEKQDVGLYDCERQSCSHFWSNRYWCWDYSTYDWNNWEYEVVGNTGVDGESGIDIVKMVYKHDPENELQCDEDCEAASMCYQGKGDPENTAQCSYDGEAFCGTKSLRAENCGSDTYCQDYYWSCTWNDRPDVCKNCWSEAADAGYDTMCEAGVLDEEEKKSTGMWMQKKAKSKGRNTIPTVLKEKFHVDPSLAKHLEQLQSQGGNALSQVLKASGLDQHTSAGPGHWR